MTRHPLVAVLLPHLGDPVAAVGGVVRDRVLGLPPGTDVDLVVEGDAIPVAHAAAERLGGELRTHRRFGTATLTVPGLPGHVDFATARREVYDRPDALPRVTPATLVDDLRRRDFTINAIAVWIAGPHAGATVDPVGGCADLALGVVRAMHQDSFSEDTSRVVRAARYAARLGFHLDAATAGLAHDAAPRVDWANPRTAGELRRLLREPDPIAGLDLLRTLGTSGLRVDLEWRIRAVDHAAAADGAPRVAGWALRLGAALDAETLHRVDVPERDRRSAVDTGEGLSRGGRLGLVGSAPSARDLALQHTSPAFQIGAVAAGASEVADWWRDGRDRTLEIKGADLLEHGTRPGPGIGRALAAARAAMLDGAAGSRDEQLAVALAELGASGG